MAALYLACCLAAAALMRALLGRGKGAAVQLPHEVLSAKCRNRSYLKG
jgi:hypothetical protein